MAKISILPAKKEILTNPLIVRVEGKTAILRCESAIYAYKVYDMSGRIIMHLKPVTGREARIPLPCPGIFVLQVSSNEGDQVIKLRVY
jgi:hypothetical protein